MSGPEGDLAEAWRLLRKNIKTDAPQPLGKYLGCEHRMYNSATTTGGDPEHPATIWPPPDTKVIPPLDPCGGSLSDSAEAPPVRKASNGGQARAKGPKPTGTRVLEYDMSGFFKSCVERYVEQARPKAQPLHKVDTPFIGDDASLGTGEGPDEARGELAPIAAKVLMKILYGARMCRYDLLRPTCHLATKITKWSKLCDKALHRLVAYVNSTLDLRLCGWIGDPPDQWEFVVYSDADFSGDRETSRSTSGVLVCLRGPNTFSPLSATSKRQT